MKKKKHLADLMEEDLLETIQQRINELNAELKLLYARHRAVSMFSLTPKLTRAFMGRTLKTPFCTL